MFLNEQPATLPWIRLLNLIEMPAFDLRWSPFVGQLFYLTKLHGTQPHALLRCRLTGSQAVNSQLPLVESIPSLTLMTRILWTSTSSLSIGSVMIISRAKRDKHEK